MEKGFAQNQHASRAAKIVKIGLNVFFCSAQTFHYSSDHTYQNKIFTQTNQFHSDIGRCCLKFSSRVIATCFGNVETQSCQIGILSNPLVRNVWRLTVSKKYGGAEAGGKTRLPQYFLFFNCSGLSSCFIQVRQLHATQQLCSLIPKLRRNTHKVPKQQAMQDTGTQQTHQNHRALSCCFSCTTWTLRKLTPESLHGSWLAGCPLHTTSEASSSTCCVTLS